MIKQMLDGLGIHAFHASQIEHDTRVELTGPRPHGQSVERGEAHRVFRAAATHESAHRAAAAQVRNNYLSLPQLRRSIMQAIRNVLVREAMEAVSAHAFTIERLGNGEPIGEFRVAAME